MTSASFRLSVTSDADPADRLAPENVSRILAIAADQRTSEQSSALGTYFRSISPLTKPIRDEISAAQKQARSISSDDSNVPGFQ